jgi:hypothetical protein
MPLNESSDISEVDELSYESDDMVKQPPVRRNNKKVESYEEVFDI